ncbi:MAG: hypothetical protein D3924_17250, partial [Candidatus Electrothrix sp. AR4]|nr:hypothetical protein [Candidatus Electrothrix sp. AR4]
GLRYPYYFDLLKNMGEIYIAMLQISVTPFIICVVSTCVGRFIRGRHAGVSLGDAGVNLGKFLFIVCLGLILVAFIGVVFGVGGNPGSELSDKTQNTLGTLVLNHAEYTRRILSYEKPVIQEDEQLSSKKILTNLIPHSLVTPLREGESLGVLLFALCIGLVLGFIPNEPAEAAFAFFKAFFNLITRCINWSMYFLPVGLFCLVASQVSRIDVAILDALIRLIIVIHLAGIVSFLICVILVSVKTGRSFHHVFAGLKDTAFIALGTKNSFVTIPSAIDELQRNFNVNAFSASLLAPVSFTLFRFGTVMLLAVTAVFMAQLYTIDLNAMTLTVALLSSLLAGAATVGISSLTMLSFVLDTLGLPFDIAFILLLTIHPVINSIVTLVNVTANCTAIILASPKGTDTVDRDGLEQEGTAADQLDILVFRGA